MSNFSNPPKKAQDASSEPYSSRSLKQSLRPLGNHLQTLRDQDHDDAGANSTSDAGLMCLIFENSYVHVISDTSTELLLTAFTIKVHRNYLPFPILPSLAILHGRPFQKNPSKPIP